MVAALEKNLIIRDDGEKITFSKSWIGSLEVTVVNAGLANSFDCGVNTEEVIEWLTDNFQKEGDLDGPNDPTE